MLGKKNTQLLEQSTNKNPGVQKLGSKRILSFARILSLVAVISVVIGGGWLLYVQQIQPAIIIGEKSISKSRYRHFVKLAAESGVSKDKVADTIIEYEKYFLISQKLNFSVNESDILSIIGSQYGLYEPAKQKNDWQYMVAYIVATKNVILNSRQDGWQGTYFAFPYSRNFVQTVKPLPNTPGFGDKNEIEKDKRYAMERANYYLTKLKDGAITPDKALEEITQDQRLEYGGAANDSTNFNIDNEGRQFSQAESVRRVFETSIIEATQKLQNNSFSSIENIKSTVNFSPISEYVGSSINVGYYFVYLKNKRTQSPDIEQQVNKELNDTRVIKNV